MFRNILIVLAASFLFGSCGNKTVVVPVMGASTVFDIDVEEISGLCLNADKTSLIACGDQGVVKSVSFTGEACDILRCPEDMEGITLDPATGDLYLAIEGSQKIARLAAPAYDTCETVFKV